MEWRLEKSCTQIGIKYDGYAALALKSRLLSLPCEPCQPTLCLSLSLPFEQWATFLKIHFHFIVHTFRLALFANGLFCLPVGLLICCLLQFGSRLLWFGSLEFRLSAGGGIFLHYLTGIRAETWPENNKST